MNFSKILSPYLKFFGYVFYASIFIDTGDSIINLITPIYAAVSRYCDISFIAIPITVIVISIYTFVVGRGFQVLYIPTLHAILGNHYAQYESSEKANAVKHVIYAVSFFVALQVVFSFSVTYFMRDATSEILVGAPKFIDTDKIKTSGDKTKDNTIRQINIQMKNIKSEISTVEANAENAHPALLKDLGKTSGWAEKELRKIHNKASDKQRQNLSALQASLVNAQNDQSTLLVLTDANRKNIHEKESHDLKAKSYSKLLMWIAIAFLFIALLTGWIIANFNRAFDDGSFHPLIPVPKNVPQYNERVINSYVPQVTQEKPLKTDSDVTREAISRWCSDARLYFERYVAHTDAQVKKDNFERYQQLAKNLQTVGIFCKTDNNKLVLENEREVKNRTPKAQAKDVEFVVA